MNCIYIIIPSNLVFIKYLKNKSKNHFFLFFIFIFIFYHLLHHELCYMRAKSGANSSTGNLFINLLKPRAAGGMSCDRHISVFQLGARGHTCGPILFDYAMMVFTCAGGSPFSNLDSRLSESDFCLLAWLQDWTRKMDKILFNTTKINCIVCNFFY